MKWPTVQEFNPSRILLMQEGAKRYLDWMNELAIHGIISLLDSGDQLQHFAARMVDFQLPRFSTRLLKIHEQIIEGSQDFPEIIQSLLDLTLIARGLKNIGKFNSETQWHIVTAAGLNLNKNQLNKYAEEKIDSFYAIYVYQNNEVNLPYQITWFSDGLHFYYHLEYSFQSQFTYKFNFRKNYQLRYLHYPDYTNYRIFINDYKEYSGKHPFKQIPSLASQMGKVKSALENNPYIQSIPIFFSYTQVNKKYMFNHDDQEIIEYSVDGIFNEILNLSTAGIIFGIFKNHILIPYTLIVDNEVIMNENI